MIQDNKQVIAQEKKRTEELEATRSQVQRELTIHSFGLEALWTQHATKKLLIMEELQNKAMVVAEETRQRDIQELKEQIQSLTQRD